MSGQNPQVEPGEPAESLQTDQAVCQLVKYMANRSKFELAERKRDVELTLSNMGICIAKTDTGIQICFEPNLSPIGAEALNLVLSHIDVALDELKIEASIFEESQFGYIFRMINFTCGEFIENIDVFVDKCNLKMKVFILSSRYIWSNIIFDES